MKAGERGAKRTVSWIVNATLIEKSPLARGQKYEQVNVTEYYVNIVVIGLFARIREYFQPSRH